MGTGRHRYRGRVAAGVAVAVALVLAACGGVSGESEAGSSESSSTRGQGGVDPIPRASAGAAPVIDEDFPDPDVLEVDGAYYAYATNGNGRNVRVARSTDLVTWESLGDAMPQLPSWVIPGKTWAPEVTEVGPGQFVLYFTATNFRPALQCVGVAVADSPGGPFVAVGESMLVCPPDEGGAIDASTFLDDDGVRYLLWKNDGNCCGLDTWLQIAPLAPDGLSLAGPVTRLLQQDQLWEGQLVEAPTLVKRDGTYVLVYSANDYGSAAYAIGYASAPAVTGPYTKAGEPLLSTDQDPRFVGPGGQDLVVGPDGTDRLVFHSWSAAHTYRGMSLVPVSWANGIPALPLS